MANEYDNRKQNRKDHKWGDRFAKVAKWGGRLGIGTFVLWLGNILFNRNNNRHKS